MSEGERLDEKQFSQPELIVLGGQVVRVSRVRITVRWVMFVVAVIGIRLGFLANSAQRQKSAISAITRVDGYYYYDFQIVGETYSQVEHPSGPDWLWKHVDLSYVCDVKAVGLNCKAATDDTLREIANLHRLETLDLTDSRITDDGLRHLRSLATLKYLRLDGTETKDAGMSRLEALTRLQTLFLCNTKVTDAGLAHLKGLTRLRELYLEGTQVTDAGVSVLQRAMPHLAIYHRATDCPTP